MSKQYYNSALTGAEIDKALKAVSDLVTQNNNGKILTIENGKFAAKKPAEIAGTAVLEALNVSANGDYYPESGVDGFDEVHVTVPSYPEPTGTIQISSNGTVNVKDYASAEVNVPSGITAADEGKVVKNGALVAQTARATAIAENGTYDTTENNEVTINVQGGGGGSSGVYVGTTAPDSSIGSNGEYYYQRIREKVIFNEFTKDSTSSQKGYGYEFTSAKHCVLKNFRFRCDADGRDVKIVIGTTSEVEAESSYVQSVNGEFVLTDLAAFEVEANVNYVVKAVTENSSGLIIAYGKFSIADNTITRVRNVYGASYPGSQESPKYNNYIAVIFDVEDTVYHVEKEYYKSNGQWSEI